MKCVALRHVEFEDLGSFGPLLARRGWDVSYVDAPRALDLAAAIGDPDLLVILGGPMGVYESDRFPFLIGELAVAADRMRRNRPVMGICLGAQIMAGALGARVHKAPAAEIGWYPVELSSAGRADPAASQLGSQDPFYLHWHGDTFDLPPGAIRLASSRRTAQQAFRFGAQAYAVQFHLEVVPGDIRLWTEELAPQLAGRPESQTAAEIEAGARVHGPAAARRAARFLETWLDRILPSPESFFAGPA